MHRQWLVAERRIDGALAGMTACGLWFLVLPVTVLLTDITWNSQFSMALMVALPLGVVFAGVFLSAWRVARAIEERDQEELDRWREMNVAPREVDLLRTRLHRDHHPMLGVIAVMSFYVVALAVVCLPRFDNRAMSGCAFGILLIGLGLGCGALTLALPLRSRVKLWCLVLVGWTVPAGAVMCSMALILGSKEIARVVDSPTMTSIVYVILGIVVLLAALSFGALWIVWCSKALRGHGLVGHVRDHGLFERSPDEDSVSAHDDPDNRNITTTLTASSTSVQGSPTDSDGVSPEFDEIDVDIVTGALRHSPTDLLLMLLIVVATGVILALSFAGNAGTPLHGGVATILLAACLMYCYRVWRIL